MSRDKFMLYWCGFPFFDNISCPMTFYYSTPRAVATNLSMHEYEREKDPRLMLGNPTFAPVDSWLLLGCFEWAT